MVSTPTKGNPMKITWCGLAIALCPLCLCGDRIQSSPSESPVPHRSPIDVAVLPGGKQALTANHTSDSASLVDLVSGKVLAEVHCGRKPSAVACTRDGKRAAVSNLWSGSLTLIEVNGEKLQSTGEVPIGDMPRGLVFAPDGQSLYVALGGANEVVQLDWQTRKVLRRWPSATEPRRLTLTRDGRFLAAACGRSSQVRCWDTQTGKQLWERTINDAFNLHGLAFSPDGKELIAAHIHDRHRSIAKHNIEEGWAIDNRLSRVTLEPDPRADYWQIALDTRGLAVGDPCAAAFNTTGHWLVVAAGGTQELLLFQAADIPWSGGEPGDFLDASLDRDNGKFRRVPLAGRPVAVEFIADREQVVVANYMLDAIQIVDVKSGKLDRTIALGGPVQLSPARQGEAIFYDARRSLSQWFSCHTCHPDGHTSGKTFDTLNDDSYGSYKLTPSLRGVTKTGPWTWHGRQKDLGQAVEKSLTQTLYGPKPTAQDKQAMLAFLETLDHPPNPYRNADGSLSVLAERGKVLFHGKAHCVTCHQGEHYTSSNTYDVKLETDGGSSNRTNPPSLRGVYDRGPYLHDARAESLEELLRDHHVPTKLGGETLTPEERHDLIEFLKTL